MKISAMDVVFYKTKKLRSEDPIRLFFLSLVGVRFGDTLAFEGPKDPHYIGVVPYRLPS